MRNVIILFFIFYSFISFSYSLELDNLNVIALEGPITIKQDLGFQYEISSIESITENNIFNFNSIFRGFLGILSLLIIAFLFSRNKRNIDWKLVLKGLVIQLIFAVLILKVPIVSKSFEFVGTIFTKIISFTQDGTIFLFSSFDSGIIESPLVNFVVMILPTVIFFSAITSLFYYWG